MKIIGRIILLCETVYGGSFNQASFPPGTKGVIVNRVSQSWLEVIFEGDTRVRYLSGTEQFRIISPLEELGECAE